MVRKLKSRKNRGFQNYLTLRCGASLCNLEKHTMVAELIDVESKQWKREHVLNSFIAFEANEILNIPRSWRLPEDKTQEDLELGKEWSLFCSIGISSIQGGDTQR